ncbi:unnamed protein product [Arabidopsis thaliana]|uniref:Uncharacterized protein n=1 Tax=Arabidopsis thaliana TaxID=3702 RepID=Q9FJ68_ARATH|nr:unnamed protein product [Arabidopsis thaliana]
MVKEARSIPICNIETNDLVKCHPAFTGIETTRHLRDLTVAHWSEPLIYNAFARTSLISPGKYHSNRRILLFFSAKKEKSYVCFVVPCVTRRLKNCAEQRPYAAALSRSDEVS